MESASWASPPCPRTGPRRTKRDLQQSPENKKKGYSKAATTEATGLSRYLVDKNYDADGPVCSMKFDKVDHPSFIPDIIQEMAKGCTMEDIYAKMKARA